MSINPNNAENPTPGGATARRARRQAVMRLVVAIVSIMSRAMVRPLIVIIVFVALVCLHTKPEPSRMLVCTKSEDNLKQLFIMMTMYAYGNSNCYPSMQPLGSTTNGGVRDLYPLYAIQTNKRKFLELLRPPGMKLVPFSANPGLDEFDDKHIGYVYNSTVVPQESSNPPMMAERGVSDGVLSKHEQTARPDGAYVLLANGEVRWLRCKGHFRWLPGGTKLDLGDIRLEDLKKLK